MFLRLTKRPEVAIAALIPNMLTTLALSCGLASIHFSITAAVLRERLLHTDPANADTATMHLWEKALAGVLLSAVFDALDGRAARLLRVTSKFGTVLDSLSDFVSFGVAPALVLHQWTLAGLVGDPSSRLARIAGLLPVMTFAICSGMRLARFTAATEKPKPSVPSNYFEGLPTPAAAGIVLVPAALAASGTINWTPPTWLVVVYTLLIAFLMISRVPMFALKSLKVGRKWIVPILLLVVLGVVMIINDVWLTIAVISLTYLASTPLAIVGYMRHRAALVPV